jgi:hypothetical protein
MTPVIQTGTPKDPTLPGVILLRRPKGRNYTFLIGGPSWDRAHAAVNWDVVEQNGNWVFFHGEDGVYRLTRPTN